LADALKVCLLLVKISGDNSKKKDVADHTSHMFNKVTGAVRDNDLVEMAVSTSCSVELK
jgi:hypothetical protein